jgi:hypothetical protein
VGWTAAFQRSSSARATLLGLGTFHESSVSIAEDDSARLFNV